jgi:hypothetical protein
MRHAFICAAVLLLSACGGTPSNYYRTVPGAAMPRGWTSCVEYDQIGRCKEWRDKSDQCINPAGIDAVPPLVPCTSIRRVTGDHP